MSEEESAAPLVEHVTTVTFHDKGTIVVTTTDREDHHELKKILNIFGRL